MMGRNTQEGTLRQRILSPLAAGFELVTGRWWLLLLPVALDMFLWLGPRLNIASLWEQMVVILPEAGVPAETLAQLAEAARATNLFGLLSFPYFGVPVLMSGVLTPASTPVATTSLSLEGDLTTLAATLLILGGGVLLAVAYHYLIVRALAGPAVGGLRRLPRLTARLFGLVAFVTLAMLLMYVPLTLFAGLVGLLSPAISLIVLTLGMALMVWYLLFLGFSVHGIVLAGLPVLSAVRLSIGLIQRQMAPALWLLIIVFGGRFLLGLVWRAVDLGNWLTLVSIVGHAFVVTSLIAGTYVFFGRSLGAAAQEPGIVDHSSSRAV